MYKNGPGRMTKMTTMPIYAKKIKNLLLQNQESYDLENWHWHRGLNFYKVYTMMTLG